MFFSEELKKQLEDAEASYIVTIPQFAGKAKEVQNAIPNIKVCTGNFRGIVEYERTTTIDSINIDTQFSN